MKTGDLVKHRFEGRWDDIGIVINYQKNVTGVPGGMVGVMWCPDSSHNNKWLYRSRDLELVCESR